MSIAKKRAQKSLNQSSLSELSSSENIRDCSIFKNYALLQIQNIGSNNQSKSSRKQQVQDTSTRKKLAAKKDHNDSRMKSKENQKSRENKATINYSGLAKIVEEKNIVINNQERQIQNLKCSLDRVKKELELTRVDFDKKKFEDLAYLKRQQDDNEQNIKQLQVLRIGMRQLKNRIESLQAEKSHLSKKSHEYLKQNQDLTVKLTSLKQQYSSNYLPSQQAIAALSNEISVLKEQQKQSKELQSQKCILEERCRSLERKINEYVLRYNQVQSEYNETQIKYYRAQKQNDDLKMHIEELEIENRNSKKMLDEEKKIMSQMIEKWKERIVRLEDVNKVGKDKKYNVAIQIQERCSKLEQTQIQSKINQKQIQIKDLKMINTLLSSQIQILKCELQKEKQQKQRIIQKQEKDHSSFLNQRLKLEKQFQNFKQKILKMETQINDKTKQVVKQKEQLQSKNLLIVQMKEKIDKISQELKQIAQVLQLRNEQVKQERLNYDKINQQLRRSQQVIAQKNSRIAILEELQKSLRSQILSFESQIYLNQLSIKTIESSLLQKVAILQLNVKQLQNRNSQQSEQLASKTSQISRMEGIISKINGQLKEIKAVVEDYRHKIQQCNEEIINGEKRYQTQAYLSKQAQLKQIQQINYYKNKYEQNFKHNIGLSNSIRQLQNQLVDQVNKNTDLIKSISQLESQIQDTRQNKSMLQMISIKEMESHNTETIKLKNQIARHEQQAAQLKHQNKQIQRKINLLALQNQNLVKQSHKMCQFLKQSSQQAILVEKSKHTKEIMELTKRYEEENKKNMDLEELRFKRYNQIFKEQQASLQTQIELGLKEIENKNIALHQMHSAITQKDGQIQKIKNFKFVIQSEQIAKIKEYNFALIKQAQDNSVQLNKNYQELRETVQQSQKYRSSINHLQKEIINLQNRNIELSNELNFLRCTAFQQNQENSRTITDLRAHISTCEQKIKCQIQEIGLWMHKYESTDKQLKKIQSQCNRVSRTYLEESSRKNKQNGRDIENFKTQIKLLQQQNLNLQKIMDKELGKRKIIIQELIHEKKMLYQQIGH